MLSYLEFNYLKHNSEYGQKHYRKIDNYYGPGKPRYFWSKEEWDAYNEEKEKLLDNARKEVAARDNYNKNKGYAQNAEADRASKEKEIKEKTYQEEQNRIKDINERLSKTSDSEEAYNIIIETKEAKDFVNYLKKAVKEAYDSGEIATGEFDDGVHDIIGKAKDEYYNKKGNPLDKYRDSLNTNDFLSGIILTDLVVDARDYYEGLIKVSNSQNARYNAEQQYMKATYEQNVKNNNVKAVYETVNNKINGYFNKRKVTVDDTIEIDDYLSDLRSIENSMEGYDKIKLKATEMSLEEDMMWINYQRKNKDAIENGDGNCRLCSLCMDLRARGLDVSAANANDFNENDKTFRSSSYGSGDLTKFFWETEYEGTPSSEYEDKGIGEFYKDYQNAKVYAFTDMTADVNKIMSKHKGESGIMDVAWKDADYGHAVYWTVSDSGLLTIYDAQTNEVESWDNYKNRITIAAFTRTDNLEPDYENLIKKGYIVYD